MYTFYVISSDDLFVVYCDAVGVDCGLIYYPEIYPRWQMKTTKTLLLWFVFQSCFEPGTSVICYKLYSLSYFGGQIGGVTEW